MWAAVASGGCALIALAGNATAGPHDALITKHASAYGVPEKLVRRVIHIESKGNPRVVSKGNYGLMQIRLGTAKSMGYHGTAEGLLDADTNMTYAVKYLASAYRAAGCSEDRAINYYQRGFYKKPTSRCAVPPSENVQVASKDSPSISRAAIQRSAAAERDAPPPDVLRPKVVQVETFSRPKTPSPPPTVQLAAAPAAPAVAVAPAAAPAAPVPTAPAAVVAPAAPVAVAPAAVAAPVAPVAAVAPAKPATVVAPVAAVALAAATEPRSSDIQLPQSPPLPVAARRPDRTPPQTTMAKAAAEETWPPSEPSQLAMLPMPKSRPAKAPKSPEMQLAKLDDPDAVPLPLPKPEVEAAPEREAKPARRASHRHVRSHRRQPETPSLIAFLQKLTTPPKPQRRRR